MLIPRWLLPDPRGTQQGLWQAPYHAEFTEFTDKAIIQNGRLLGTIPWNPGLCKSGKRTCGSPGTGSLPPTTSAPCAATCWTVRVQLRISPKPAVRRSKGSRNWTTQIINFLHYPPKLEAGMVPLTSLGTSNILGATQTASSQCLVILAH